MQKCVTYIFNLKVLLLIIFCLISAPTFKVHAFVKVQDYALNEAKNYISKLIEDVAQINSIKNIEEQRELLQDLIAKNIEIEAASKFVLSRYYNQFNKEQLNSFENEYKIYLKKKYALILSGHQGKVKVVGAQARENNTFVIKTKVDFNDQNPLEISYILLPKNNTLYIFDIILAQGIRLSLADREEFGKKIQQAGVESLLETIKILNKSSEDNITNRNKQVEGSIKNRKKKLNRSKTI